MKIVTADITGSLIVNNVDVTEATVSSSIWSGSAAAEIANLQATSSTLVVASASFALVSSSYVATSASYVITSGSYAASSASLSIRVTNVEATASVNTQASASFAVVSASFSSTSASLSTRVTNEEATSSILTSASASFAVASGSISSRVTLIEGQYATTGSNNFTKPQQITDVSNAISFTSTASLYTEGGLRVKGSSFTSGTAYFNDVVIYGTSSVQYITSSQLAIGTNIITLNTDTPSVRYGGISVFDSGSNNLSTSSLFWDSEKDKWIYSNPSGSTYDGGMIMSGPRNTSGLGNEVGTTNCALMMGQGGDHITSSAIFSYGNATCFYGNSYISSSGNAYFTGCVGIGTAPTSVLHVHNAQGPSVITNSVYNCVCSVWNSSDGSVVYFGSITNHPLQIITNNATRLTVANTGESIFACSVCSPSFRGGSNLNALNALSALNASTTQATIYSYNYCAAGWSIYSAQGVNYFASSTGIGAAAPVRKLDVVSTSEQLRLAYDTNGTVYTDFRSDSAGGLLVNTSGPYIINYIDGNAKMRIDATAICFACQVCASGFYSNCSIGVNSYNSAIPLQIKRWAGSSGTMALIGNDNVVGMPSINFCNDNGGGTAYASLTSNCQINLNGGMYVCPSGFVGIGTASPSGNLHVLGANTTNVSYFQTNGASNRYILNVNNLQNNAQVDFRVHGCSYSETLFSNSMTNAAAILGQPASGAVFAIGNYNNGPLVLGTNNAERMRITCSGVTCFSNAVCASKIVLNGYQNSCTYYISGFLVSNDGNNTYNIAGVTTGTYTIAIAHIDWEATYAIAGNNMTIGYTVAGTRRGTNDTVWVNSCCALLSSGDAPHPAFGWSNGLLQAYVPLYDGLYFNARITTYGTSLSFCI